MSKKTLWLLIIFVTASVALLIKKPVMNKIHEMANIVEADLPGHFILTSDLKSQQLLDITIPNFFLKHDYFILATDPILAKQIQVFVEGNLDRDTNKTSLCELFLKYGSDKSTWHNYSQIYGFLFNEMKNSATDIFEVGLGTNNVDVPSNMGKYGKPGASLYGWKDFFPKANIYGADVDKRVLFTADRIKTYYVDQLNTDTIGEMWKEIGDIKFDLVLDDGLHTYEAGVNFIEHSYERVKSGGFYVIEDINMDNDNIIKFYNFIREHNYPAVIVKLPSSQYHPDDNCLLIIKKP